MGAGRQGPLGSWTIGQKVVQLGFQHLHSRALGFERGHPFLARPVRGNACTPLRTTAGSARQDRSPSLSTQKSQNFNRLTLPGHDRPSSPARYGHLIIRVPELLAIITGASLCGVKPPCFAKVREPVAAPQSKQSADRLATLNGCLAE
jgi:hypothetical protein